MQQGKKVHSPKKQYLYGHAAAVDAIGRRVAVAFTDKVFVGPADTDDALQCDPNDECAISRHGEPPEKKKRKPPIKNPKRELGNCKA